MLRVVIRRFMMIFSNVKMRLEGILYFFDNQPLARNQSAIRAGQVDTGLGLGRSPYP